MEDSLIKRIVWLSAVLFAAGANLLAQLTDSSTGPHWRTAAANDIDGDHKYGTDGYVLYGWGVSADQYLAPFDASTADSRNRCQLPSYISAITSAFDNRLWSGSAGGNYGTLEQPDSPANIQQAPVLLGENGANGDVIRLTIARKTDQAFRLTLIIGGGDGGQFVSDNQDVEIHEGSMLLANVVHTGLPTVGLSYLSFDIGTGTDPIAVSVSGGSDGDNTHLTGLAFDHAPVPLPKLAIQKNSGQDATITWTGGGVLETANSVFGPWMQLAALSSPVLIPFGQSQVFFRVHNEGGYSVNAVGVVSCSLRPGYQIVTNPLDAGAAGNSVSKLLAGVPEGTCVYKYVNGTGYIISDYSALFGWSNPGMSLAPGEGFIVYLPGTSSFEIVFVGEVLQGTLEVPLYQGLNLVGSKVPQAGSIQSKLGLVPTGGLEMYRFDSQKKLYEINSYDPDFQEWGYEPTVNIAEGFWINTPRTITWTQAFRINP